jgi:hypothetical protein
MRRRRFVSTSAGFSALLLSPGMFSCSVPESKSRSFDFQTIYNANTLVPITRVSPPDGHYIHTYYDICSLSPSQRYLATSKLPALSRLPALGDGHTVECCVIDLVEHTIRTVYSTRCFGYQVGANLEWGTTDRYLYTNDIIGGRAVCVRIDLETGQIRAYEGAKYNIAPDESAVIAFPLEYLNVTQQGYGAPSPDPANPPALAPGAAADEGVWRTDLQTGERKLLYSLADVAAYIPEPAAHSMDGATFYFWHCKYNPQGTKIMQVLRCKFPDGWGRENAMAFTVSADGREIYHTPSEPVWQHMGGHPNWHPDGNHLLRNLSPGGGPERFCKLHYDGSGGIQILSEKFKGGGHPTVEPRERFCITDAFPKIDGRQMVRIRLIDLAREEETTVCTLSTLPRSGLVDSVFRFDGHPFWGRDHRKVVFQAAPDGMRQLYLADLSEVLA